MSAADRQDRICKKKITREINKKTKEEACRERLQNPRPQNHEANVSKYTLTPGVQHEVIVYIYTCITLSLFTFWVKTF